MSKAAKFRIAIAFALALVAVVAYVMLPTSLERRSGVVSQGSFGGPFSLLDHNGQTVTDSRRGTTRTHRCDHRDRRLAEPSFPFGGARRSRRFFLRAADPLITNLLRANPVLAGRGAT